MKCMNEVEFESAPVPTRPSTLTVVGMLSLTAATLSYLGSYAIANALVAAELLKAWPRDHDPRPRWFMTGFAILISLFLIIVGAARRSSAKQMKRIEEEMEADEAAEPTMSIAK
jgi:hypothetical protein